MIGLKFQMKVVDRDKTVLVFGSINALLMLSGVTYSMTL